MYDWGFCEDSNTPSHAASSLGHFSLWIYFCWVLSQTFCYRHYIEVLYTSELPRTKQENKKDSREFNNPVLFRWLAPPTLPLRSHYAASVGLYCRTQRIRLSIDPHFDINYVCFSTFPNINKHVKLYSRFAHDMHYTDRLYVGTYGDITVTVTLPWDFGRYAGGRNWERGHGVAWLTFVVAWRHVRYATEWRRSGCTWPPWRWAAPQTPRHTAPLSRTWFSLYW